MLSYLRSTYPEEQQCGHFCQKSFKVISGLRNTDLMTFPFSSKNRKRRVPEKISCKFFGMFHKTLTFFGGWATFLTDVVRVSFQSTKKTCETVFPEQFPKIATYLGHIEQKKFDVFLTTSQLSRRTVWAIFFEKLLEFLTSFHFGPEKYVSWFPHCGSPASRKNFGTIT